MNRMPKISFVGDLTIDKYVDSGDIRLGGAALNSAIWAKRLGAKASIVTSIGNDQPAELFIKKINEEKINAVGIQIVEGATSSIAIHVNAQGERSYGIWNPGTLAKYHLRGMDILHLHTQDAVAITIYPQYIRILDELRPLRIHRNKKPLIVINFGDLREFHAYPAVVDEYCQLADICVFGLDKQEDENRINDLRSIARRTDTIMLITLASHGSLVYTKKDTFVQPAQQVQAIDTTGGGDAFLAGFLVSYCKNHDITQSLQAGTDTATKAILQLGAY